MNEEQDKPGQCAQKQEFIAWQSTMIQEQSAWGMPVDKITVKCVCNKKVKLIDTYRCLYCEIWYCQECAEEHFGKTRKQHIAEKAVDR